MIALLALLLSMAQPEIPETGSDDLVHRCEAALQARWDLEPRKLETLEAPYAISLSVWLPNDLDDDYAIDAGRARTKQDLLSAYPGLEEDTSVFSFIKRARRGTTGYLSLTAWSSLGQRPFFGICSVAHRNRLGGVAVSVVRMTAPGLRAHRDPVIHAYWLERDDDVRP